MGMKLSGKWEKELVWLSEWDGNDVMGMKGNWNVSHYFRNLYSITTVNVPDLH